VEVDVELGRGQQVGDPRFRQPDPEQVLHATLHPSADELRRRPRQTRSLANVKHRMNPAFGNGDREASSNSRNADLDQLATAGCLPSAARRRRRVG